MWRGGMGMRWDGMVRRAGVDFCIIIYLFLIGIKDGW